MEGYIGVIKALGFSFTPRDWGYCAGALVAVGQYSALFSLIGTWYGGNGSSNFALPDLRGRSGMGQFQGPGLSDWALGERPGTEGGSLVYTELPAHSHAHTYSGPSGGGPNVATIVEVATRFGTEQIPTAGEYLAMPSDSFATAAEGNLYITPGEAAAQTIVPIGGVTSTGGSFESTHFSINMSGPLQPSPIKIQQPCLVVNYCICLDGLYPSRS